MRLFPALVAVVASSLPVGPASAQATVGGGALRVEVGKSVVVSPVVTRLVCDDPIVEAVPTAEGMTFKGLRPGKTLCSFDNGVPVRVIVEVEVVPAPAKPGK
jgi:hypothetical protein